MEMPCEISSGVNMVSAVPSVLEPCRRDAPEQWQQASISVVFPDPPWPTTTTLRMRSVVNEGADAMIAPPGEGWLEGPDGLRPRCPPALRPVKGFGGARGGTGPRPGGRDAK